MVEGIGWGLLLLRWEGRERGGLVGWGGVEWSGVELWWGGLVVWVSGEWNGGVNGGEMGEGEGGKGKVGMGVVRDVDFGGGWRWVGWWGANTG